MQLNTNVVWIHICAEVQLTGQKNSRRAVLRGSQQFSGKGCSIQTVDIQSYHERVREEYGREPRPPARGRRGRLLDGELHPRPGVGTMTPRKHHTLGVV